MDCNLQNPSAFFLYLYTMKHTLKHIFFTILITSVLYSQVGVLMYEVYCHCKKEFSYHLHMAVSDCSISQETTVVNTACCSSAGKCSSSEKSDKPCTEKEIKLLKLEDAKATAELSFDLEDIKLPKSTVAYKEYFKLEHYSSEKNANAPPNLNLAESVFKRNTIPFIQSFLC